MFDFDTTEKILGGIGILIAVIGFSLLKHVVRTNELLEQINSKLFRLEKHFSPHFETRDD
jgi:hypothetical protein